MITKNLIYIPILLAALMFSQTARSTKRWQGSIPVIAENNKKWHKLVKKLMKEEMHYGALVAAYRMLTFFNDLKTKELAYKTIIELVDRGYPYSVRSFYVAGDIEPTVDYDFANSYNFYKGVVNEERGFEKWASHYFESVDTENFPKYLFFQAINQYAARDLKGAEKTLKSILAKDFKGKKVSFVSKVSRTLARVYFEQAKYKESIDIYDTFLLRLNPVTPGDWLEASWSLYYLNQNNKALGFLYNLESGSHSQHLDLEKFVLRALIYKQTCGYRYMSRLVYQFERRFGRTIKGIRTGENLNTTKLLNIIRLPENSEFLKIFYTHKELVKEKKQLANLSRSQRKLAEYLYSSEIKLLKRQYSLRVAVAQQKSANYLVNLYESLRFLTFDVARERHNPDNVFINDEEDNTGRYVENLGNRKFRLNWFQQGDYWRDERTRYRGVTRNRCGT